MKISMFLGLFAVGVLIVLASSAGAQGPNPQSPTAPQATLGAAFTYQGELRTASSPVNGTCDFHFSLWDTLSGGAQVGGAQAVNSVSVVNGHFTVQLDFGASAFSGEARWLQIAVQCGGDPGMVLLAPRQQLTPAPYALALPGLRTTQNNTSPNVIGGHISNTVTSGVFGAVIGGGGENGYPNQVTNNYGAVGGGYSNMVSGMWAVVGGGDSNTASGDHATIPGGQDNIAAGDYSFAGGYRAQANHPGTFVWGDSTEADIVSTKANQVVIRATNGMNLSVSAGNTKRIEIGEHYRDNAIVAWAKISSDGTVPGTADFGVASVQHINGTGIYTVTLDVLAFHSNHLIPIAMAEVDSPPVGAANVRIVSINQLYQNQFIVYINNGNWELMDNEFVFMVTAR